MNYNKKVLSKINLSIDAEIQQLTAIIKKAIMQDDSLECKRIDDFLDQYFQVNEKFAKEHPEIFAELQDLQIACRWVALHIIHESKVLECYDKYINIGWSIPNNFDYWIDPDNKYDMSHYFFKQKLINRLNTYWDFNDRDKLKNQIQGILKNSEQVITSTRLMSNNATLKATLSNWFTLYFAEVGAGQTNKLKMAQFFSANKNFQKISPDEKEKLKAIFNLYELFKLSSRSVEGNEQEISYEDEEGSAVVQYGNLERYSKKDLDYFNEYIKKNKEALLKAKIIDESFLHPPAVATKSINDKKNMDIIDQYKEKNEPKGVVHDIFNEHDQQEIANHKPSGLKKLPANNSQQIIATLKQNLSLTFKEITLETRFDSLIVSYVRGLRDAMELKESLTRATDVGGMGFGWDVAEKIVATLKSKNITTPIAEIKIVSGTMPAAAIKKPALPSFSDMQAMMKKTNAKSTKLPPIKPVVPPAPIVISAKNSLPKKEYSSMIPQVKRLNPSKPIVQDIKMPPKDIKLVGPLEELQFIDINKFRRSAETSVEAAEKIKAKIDLLEEQSFTEKAKGIVAFKNSPLNKMYLKVGNKSIEAGRSVVEVIAELTQAGESTLTKEEFDVIADLNKKLRF